MSDDKAPALADVVADPAPPAAPPAAPVGQPLAIPLPVLRRQTTLGPVQFAESIQMIPQGGEDDSESDDELEFLEEGALFMVDENDEILEFLGEHVDG